jgi:hypothetical protein
VGWAIEAADEKLKVRTSQPHSFALPPDLQQVHHLKNLKLFSPLPSFLILFYSEESRIHRSESKDQSERCGVDPEN